MTEFWNWRRRELQWFPSCSTRASYHCSIQFGVAFCREHGWNMGWPVLVDSAMDVCIFAQAGLGQLTLWWINRLEACAFFSKGRGCQLIHWLFLVSKGSGRLLSGAEYMKCLFSSQPLLTFLQALPVISHSPCDVTLLRASFNVRLFWYVSGPLVPIWHVWQGISGKQFVM